MSDPETRYDKYEEYELCRGDLKKITFTRHEDPSPDPSLDPTELEKRYFSPNEFPFQFPWISPNLRERTTGQPSRAEPSRAEPSRGALEEGKQAGRTWAVRWGRLRQCQHIPYENSRPHPTPPLRARGGERERSQHHPAGHRRQHWLPKGSRHMTTIDSTRPQPSPFPPSPSTFLIHVTMKRC